MDISRLREKVEDICKEFEAYLLETKDIEHAQALLAARDLELHEFEKQLNLRQEQLARDKEELVSQQAFTEKSNTQLQIRQREIDSQKISLAEHQKKLDGLDERQIELERHENLVTEREKADQLRKDLLDARQKKLDDQIKRLQAMTEID